MTLELLIQIGTLISIIIGFASVVFTVRAYRRQLNAQAIISYAERYEKIMDAFPESSFALRFESEDKLPSRSDKITLCVLKYLNLSSEEYYLWTKGYIANDVWMIWEGELKRMLRTQLVKREWETLRAGFESYPEFVSYVEAEITKSQN